MTSENEQAGGQVLRITWAEQNNELQSLKAELVPWYLR